MARSSVRVYHLFTFEGYLPTWYWEIDMLAETSLPASQPAMEKFLADGEIFGNGWHRWVMLLGVILASMVVGKFFSFFLNRHGRNLKKSSRAYALGVLLESLSGPISLLTLAGGLYFSATLKLVVLPPELAHFWLQVCSTISVLAATWFVFKFIDVIEYLLTGLTSRTETTLDDQLVPLIRKALRVLVVIMGGLFIVQNIFKGEVGTLIAGLGLGGLAFALAAKDMLANLFGSLAIFADRPFTLGERVKINGQDGKIEEVGFRSTRIRTLSGHLVTIPNATVANEMIENISRRPFIKRMLEVTVTYDTAPEKLAEGVAIIEQMLEARKSNFPEDLPGRVFFSDFGSTSLNIIVYYWFTPPQWWDYLQFTHDFNMELLSKFNEAGIEFAFPTQTLYVKQNSELSAKVQIERLGEQ